MEQKSRQTYTKKLKKIELEKAYNPANFEERIYARWKNEGHFRPSSARANAARIESTGERFVIVIPPPNVTGVLHMGHGLDHALQDIMIRFHRMRGDDTLWVPGTDHAGIATQNVVEKRLKKDGKSRHDLGRDAFVEETWRVKAEHHTIITRQMERMGDSVDWDRERFTMDEGLSRAVRDVFVTLYERGLLYRGNYLVNWCMGCGTALADDEVEHEDMPGRMYHLRYPLTDGTGFVEIATTRPETLLGDTAVAVHPEDERYAALVGKTVNLPLTNRAIPVIADTYIDRAFGTGVVKITPAHDPNDWEVGQRHDLESINLFTPDGRLNAAAPEKYQGMTIEYAREAVLSDLKEQGFFIKEEPITHAVGHCYRCHTVIEPFLSEQWFVRMKPLADKALAAWERGEVVFYPRKWENTYKHWLSNIKDWCVSRQLWWGHRIPVWYCLTCGETIVSRTDTDVCPHCGGAMRQDEDVLDTWFSSWLWPFSTLGWEHTHSNTEDLRRFYPTSALVTGYDIIFFWVSRMIMAGLEFTGKAPFRDIFIHGLVRDKHGKKMSKSAGNGLDPIELVDEFGADAVKFTLAFLCAQGQDILLDKESFKLGSKFANKVWNASRYILMNLEGRELVENPELLPIDKWIYARLNNAAKTVSEAFLSYRYNDAASAAYEFFWNDFCDWYVEATKLSFRLDEESEQNVYLKNRAATVLLDVLLESLRLLHPFLPFVTEEIYGFLPNTEGLLITAPYPAYHKDRTYPQIESDFAFLQELIRTVRTLRSECSVPPDRKVDALVRTARTETTLAYADLVKLLANIDVFSVEEPAALKARPAGSIGSAGAKADFEVFVFIADAVDLGLLKQKFARELDKDNRFIKQLRDKLANSAFLQNAPPELVEGEKLKLADALARAEKISSYMQDMEA